MTRQLSSTHDITFSHFLPRLDLVPACVPSNHRVLDQVLGSTRLEEQLRRLAPDIHVYGHSHINRNVRIDGFRYINNAFGYPQESTVAACQLIEIVDDPCGRHRRAGLQRARRIGFCAASVVALRTRRAQGRLL